MHKIIGQPQLKLAMGLAMLGASTAGGAQIVPPTVPTNSPPAAVALPKPVAPVAPPPVMVPLPTITELQAVQLRAWLGDLTGQGLARTATGFDPTTLSGDTLVTAALDRARAVSAGRLATTDFLEVWALRPAASDPLPGLTDAVARDRIPQWIASLTPPYTGYDMLRRALGNYRTIAATGGWASLSAGEIGPKAAAERIAALRARLALEDRETPATGVGYDAALREAVVRAQRRYGLNPTGVVGAQTIAALNVPIAERIGSIMANMERWRWMPRDLPTHRIQVNIAAAVLTVFEGDKPVQSMRAVTGRVGDETPMLSSSIHSIVVNPPWNVPTGIAAREYWPLEKARPGTLAAKGFRIIETPGGGRRLQQAAGPLSALGRLKFDFDNPFAVYLHDTPSRGKFSSFDRLASHGCVRLEKPVELADRVLAGDPKWADGAVQAAIEAGQTQRVPLPQPVAVYLLYWTAFANSGGTVGFREDPYGWDKVLASRIDARTRAQTPVVKVATK